MLQRILNPADELHGTWTREQLEQMDSRFCEAIEQAFQAGRESPASARATVRIGTLPNGGESAIERAIESAWCYLHAKMDAGIDVSFAEIVDRCPGVDRARIRAGFERRFRALRRAG